MAREPRADEALMTPAEVATMFRVDAKTVTRWAQSGKFPEGTMIRTPGGQRRFNREKVMRVYRGEPV
jgi:excisionase family DNA binding protein